jgi:hypothetical protein
VEVEEGVEEDEDGRGEVEPVDALVTFFNEEEAGE